MTEDATVHNQVGSADIGPVVQAGTIRHISLSTAPARAAQQGVPVPRQLPPVPAGFVGRADELARLSAALDETAGQGGTVVISALAGAGGIGKTWLALRCAHQHLDRFPDGQLFVDLHGFSPANAPLDPPVVVRRFLDALGVDPGRIPADPDARAALFRSLVADRRMLILLDNAIDATQVAPLLPGGSCTVLVTSRRHLSSLVIRRGAHHLRVGVLAPVEARQALITRLGAERVAAEPDAVEELLAYCGGFPLALGIVAGRARTTPDPPLAELAAELRDHATRLGALDSEDPSASLPATLSWSLRTLTDEQARVFGLLGLAPGPDISLAAAAGLTGLSTTRTRVVLRGLEQSCLLDRDAAGRYRMHDLVRLYATDTHHLPDDLADAALRRVVDFYLHTAYAADRLLHPERPPIRVDPPVPGVHARTLSNAAAAMSWFDSEHACLLAAHHTAIARGWHHTVWRLAWVLRTFHVRRGHRHDRLAVWRAAVAAAAYLPDPGSRTLAHRFLGLAYVSLGRHKEAIGHLDRALALAEQHHDTAEQARTHQMAAWFWGQRGDHRRALDHVTRARDLYVALDQPVPAAEALNKAGWFTARLGDHDTARAHCQAALDLHRRHHNSEGEAAALESLGYIAHHAGHHRQAITHYRRALAIVRDRGHTYAAAGILDRLGRPYAALFQHDHARTAWREALDLYREQGRDEDAARVQRQLDDGVRPQ
ncbi:ATP-binding protein [Saccharothrix obliqua]|uniref:ATP-binding protein n=1 Tax=Saccharothrix obliqua TaxID=2861747 RepID=UPI001C6034A9|nr:tetratricopeptide repeat protein [Saccharothrix obliqua]MBW4718250.1 tetratricopeptide repeat protein [Saccharothrix obliqua]